jgi:GT2 family glycosyltransferase
VIVPTHNRSCAVQRLLTALTQQNAEAESFSVIVVVDGSTDDTVHVVRRQDYPFALEVVEQPALGPAAARNEGARRARGRVLLFLDDDVEPNPRVITAHLILHAESDDRIGIGMLPPVTSGDTFFANMLRFWWTDMQESVQSPGHRFSFKDLLSGHFSITRSRFDSLGGFDRMLRCHEDYELGFRAIQSGLQLRLAAGADARHHDDTTVAKALRRKFEEGVADVALAQKHPAIIGGLPFAWEGRLSRKQRLLRRIAWSGSATTDAGARMLQWSLPLYEKASLRFRWRALLEALLDYWYWRGLAAALRHPRELRALLAGAPSSPEAIELDLAEGLGAVERALDAQRPVTARLMYGQDHVATVPAYPGYEALRGAHLRPLLARWCRAAYLQTAARRGLVPEPLMALAPAITRLDED